MTYADAVAELETILAELREVPTDVDRLEERVARATELITACREQLRGVEGRLEKLNDLTEG